MSEKPIAQRGIGEYLSQLASDAPTPGGGAAGALHLAQGAALVAMVARLTNGKRFEAVAEQVEAIATKCDALLAESLELADIDAVVFAHVISTYKLPRSTEEEKAARTAAIIEATVDATKPQLDTLRVGRDILALAGELTPIANKMVLSDIAAAAQAVRAGLGTALVTLEINIAALRGKTEISSLIDSVDKVETAMELADRLAEQVRQEVSR